MRSRWSESWSHYEAKDVKENEVVMPNVRLESAAGWFIGAIEFYDYDEMNPYSRDTDYYPSENMLKSEYPHSISLEEACHKIKYDTLYKRKMERKLARR